MKLSAILAPLFAAKAPYDQILAVVRAFEDEQAEVVETSREKARERWRRWDAKRRAPNVSKRLQTTEPVSGQLARAEDKPLSTVQEQKKESSLRSDIAKQARGARLPEGWVLPDDWRQDAIEVGLPLLRIDPEAAKMADWSRSSKAGAKLDWRAAWRNWCRSAVEKLPRSPPLSAGQRPHPLSDGFGEIAAHLKRGESHDDPRTSAGVVLHLPSARREP